MSKILAISGSNRQDSFNQMTVNVIAAALTSEVTHLSLKSLALPIYDGDLEENEGQPSGAKTLREAVASHDGVVVGNPEYNGFMTPLLLNAINWATRSAEAAPDLSPFTAKPVLITGTSPGSLAGMRSAQHLRTFLAGIGCNVMPTTFSVPSSFKSFDAAGSLTDEKLSERANQVAAAFEEFVTRLS